MTTVLVAVAIIVVIGLVLAAAMSRARGSRLAPLPAGARERYAASWRAIEAQFIDSPQEAVREADRLVASLARERGLPDDRIAPVRAASAEGTGESMTEDLRRVMVQRRKAVKDLLGADPRDVRGRREVAS